MSIVYETIVSVPEDFIEKIIEKSLKSGCGVYARLKDSSFSIISRRYRDLGLSDVVDLSQEHQNIVFTAITVCEMAPERADIFEISNGEILSARQDIFFDFNIDPEDKKELKPDVIKDFVIETRKYFNMVDMHLVRNNKGDSFWDIYQAHCSSLVYYYQTDTALFKAQRKDLNIIGVEVEFLHRNNHSQSINETEDASEMDGLPF